MPMSSADILVVGQWALLLLVLLAIALGRSDAEK
jgi:hypothetical protein